MEEERIQKFKDLILNEHYCEDCNELCSIGEAFPLEFVTKYIIKLEKENRTLKRVNNMTEDISIEDITQVMNKAYEDFMKEFIPKSKIKEKIEELKEQRRMLGFKTYLRREDMLNDDRAIACEISVLQELLEKE